MYFEMSRTLGSPGSTAPPGRRSKKSWLLGGATALAALFFASAGTAQASTVLLSTGTYSGTVGGVTQSASATFTLMTFSEVNAATGSTLTTGNYLKVTITDSSTYSSSWGQANVLTGLEFTLNPGATLAQTSNGVDISGTSFATGQELTTDLNGKFAVDSSWNPSAYWGSGNLTPSAKWDSASGRLGSFSFTGADLDGAAGGLLPTNASGQDVSTSLSTHTPYTNGTVSLYVLETGITAGTTITGFDWVYGTGISEGRLLPGVNGTPGVVGDSTPLPASLGNAALLMGLFGAGYVVYRKHSKAVVA